MNNIYEEDSSEANVLIALRSYYGALVNYLLTNLKHQFENAEAPVRVSIAINEAQTSGFAGTPNVVCLFEFN